MACRLFASIGSRLGAHYIVDHSKPLATQVKALRLGEPGLVFSTTNTDLHFKEVAELIAPSLAPAVALGGLDQLLDFALSEVFAWPKLTVGAAGRRNCPFYCRRGRPV